MESLGARRWPLSDAGLSFQQNGRASVDGWRRARDGDDRSTTMTTYKQKITLGEMRASGVQRRLEKSDA